jgi:hypothetical protein
MNLLRLPLEFCQHSKGRFRVCFALLSKNNAPDLHRHAVRGVALRRDSFKVPLVRWDIRHDSECNAKVFLDFFR